MGLLRRLGIERLPLGMDIDDRIVLAAVSIARHKVQCTRFTVMEPEDYEISLRDMELDEIIRPYASSLREYVRQNRIRGSKVSISPPSDQLTIRQITLPPLPARAMRQAVMAEVGRRIQLPFEDPLLDYTVLPTPTSDGQQSVLVIAAPKAMVWPWVTLASHVGLRPFALEPGMFAVARMFATTLSASRATMLILLGRRGYDIGLVKAGAVHYLRFVSITDEDYSIREGQTKVAWDKSAFARDVSYEIDRSMAFMEYNVLEGKERISQLVIVDRLGCTEELRNVLCGRIDIPVVVPEMPFSLPFPNHSSKRHRQDAEGNPPEAAKGLQRRDDTFASMAAVAAALGLPEVSS